jgi:hypothetical protein
MNTKFLSPQSKAIVDAYSEANDCYNEELGQIASALREVVNQLKYVGLTEKNILAIAEELEQLK